MPCIFYSYKTIGWLCLLFFFGELCKENRQLFDGLLFAFRMLESALHFRELKTVSNFGIQAVH